MGTTDADLALQVISDLDRSGVDYAVLHGIDGLLEGAPTGDTDIAVDRPQHLVLRLLSNRWRSKGVTPLSVWRPIPDAGAAYTVLISDDDGQRFVALDLLHDPRGRRGPYRVRTQALLRGSVRHEGVAVASNVDSLIYLWQKRLVKNQPDRLPALQEIARRYPVSTLHSAASRLLGSPVAADQLLGASRIRRPPSHPSNLLGRAPTLIRRLTRPVGRWVHLDRTDAKTASLVADRFGRVFLRSRTLELPRSALAISSLYGRAILPDVVRGGIVVTHGIGTPTVPTPHVVLSGALSADDAIRQAVRSLRGQGHD